MAMEDTNQTQTTGEKDFKETKENKTRGFRTFETDIADYAKGKNLSLVDIAAEEAQFRGAGFEMEDEAPSSSRKLIIIFAAVFVMLGVVAGGYFVFTKNFYKSKTGGNNAKNYQLNEPPIIADDKVEIAASEDRKEIFLKDLKSILGKSGGSGKLFNVLLVKYDGENKKSVGTSEFFRLIKANAPAELTDYLEDKFMLLKLDSDDGYPVLIFKVKSYEYAFSAMMNWEKAMPWELKNVFVFGQNFNAGVSFGDKFAQNHDARALLDSNDRVKMIYSFINRKYLVIAGDEKALVEIFSRFDSPRYANPAANW